MNTRTINFNSAFEDGCKVLESKLHTIRRYKEGEEPYKKGDKLQFTIDKTINLDIEVECTLVQDIEIVYTPFKNVITIYIDGEVKFIGTKSYSSEYTFTSLFHGEDNFIELLAKNDGFDSIQDFFKYFNTDFSGQIVHWNNLKY